MHELRGTRFAVAASDAVRQNTSTSDFSFPMADTTPSTVGRANLSAGHLSVHLEGAHPAEVRFLFEEQQKRIGPALIASLAYHVAFIGFILFVFRYGADSTTPAVLPEQPHSNIIWLSQPGPGGGGGGGGNQMKEP